MRRLIAAHLPRPRAATRERPGGHPARARLLRLAPVVGLFAVAVGLACWLALSGIAARQIAAADALFDGIAGEAGVAVARVLVDGRERTDRGELVDALGIELGAPLLAVDIEAARLRVAALPWIREVAVERRLPDAIVVHIVERRPLALWQNAGEVMVVDAEGNIIEGARAADFPELLLVVGPDAPGHAAQLLAVIERTPELYTRVDAAVRVGGRRWNVRLADGIEVQLPEEELDLAWRMLADLDAAEQLLARDVQAVDLRLPDRLVLRLTADAQARLNGENVEGEDT